MQARGGVRRQLSVALANLHVFCCPDADVSCGLALCVDSDNCFFVNFSDLASAASSIQRMVLVAC